MIKSLILICLMCSSFGIYAETRDEVINAGTPNPELQAQKTTSKALIKKFGKPLEKRGVILLRKIGINKDMAVTTVILARTLAEQKAKYKVKLGNNYSIEGIFDNRNESANLMLTKKF